jgi:hypothetical protein
MLDFLVDTFWVTWCLAMSDDCRGNVLFWTIISFSELFLRKSVNIDLSFN